MATSARRERERAANRAKIIAAALKVLESETVGALTIRRVANDVEYTAPVVYQHFENKDDLLLALTVVGFEDLYARLVAATAGLAPGERLEAAARAYLTFAEQRPELYLLMNDGRIDAVEREHAAGSVIALTHGFVGDWASAHGLEVGDRQMETNEVIWGTLHGMAALGRIRSIGPAHAADLSGRALQLILRGWLTEPEAH